MLAVKRYHVTTFGCQMNAHDSERIKGMLEELGLGEAPSQAEADVLVFNTCTIREKPDQRFAAHLAQARALKERAPEKVIAVGGCYAEAQRERLFELYPYVDVAFGPGSIPHLAEWIGANGEAPRGRFGSHELGRARAREQERRERRDSGRALPCRHSKIRRPGCRHRRVPPPSACREGGHLRAHGEEAAVR